MAASGTFLHDALRAHPQLLAGLDFSGVGRGDLDIFKSKVERKGRNALGIFVGVNNFSADALAQFASASPLRSIQAEEGNRRPGPKAGPRELVH